PPADDPFYTPPKNFSTTKLGTIINYRPIPSNLTLNNKDPIFPQAAWQLLYRTQNSVGEPSVSVVTVIKPFRAQPNHLFSYSMFSDAAYSGCNPSVTLQVGTREDNTFNQLQIGILVQALALGYYVAVADYGGLQAAFSSGLQAGYATLDSLRAVFQSGEITGINAEPITTLHGYSSGAQAIGWATELHPTYAPELKIAGAAFGGVVPNLTALLELPAYLNGSRSFAGPPTILGVAHDFKNLSNWLDENLVPSLAAQYKSGDDSCISGLKQFENQDMGQYFKRGYRSIYDAVPQSVLGTTGTMGQRSTPKIPWYLYHAIGDDVSPVNLTDKIYNTHCKNGANILYERNPIPLNHRYECIYGLTGAYKWMNDRHKQIPITPGCSQ
ncbi:LIP-domain-containing protein, partial [Tothia fuscella]